MNFKNIFGVFVILAMVSMLSAVSFASVAVDYVEVNGDRLSASHTERLELSEDLDIKVRLEALGNVSDIEVLAKIDGYKYSDKFKYQTLDIVNIDDLDQYDMKTVELELKVPTDIDQDARNLKVMISDRTGTIAIYNATLNIQGADNRVDIKRVTFDPAEVVAGRALRTSVRLENLGEEDEDDMYVTVAIPELGPNMYVSTDVDELEQEEVVTTEDLLLRIPECADAGVYDVVVTVEYDNGYEESEVTEQITIVENDGCTVAAAQAAEAKDRTVITPPQSQEIAAGESGASFPLMIKNDGTEDKTYLVTISGVESWGAADVSTTASYVRAGDSEVVYVYVAADADVSGQKTFVISISDGKQTENLPVLVSVLPAAEEVEESSSFKQWMYAGIIVLLLLIVILGLAIGFKKVSGDDEDEEYY